MVEYQPGYRNSYALIIGIDSYTDPHFVSLGEAEDDARRLAEALAAPPHNFQVTLLLGEQATRRAILRALFDLRSTGPDDRVLVYFAGHGYTLVDNFGHETGYLAAVDTIPEQDFTALEMEEVTDLCRHAGAKHVGFIFDACFSGQALGLTRAQSVAAEKFTTRRAYQVISAGAGDQTVSDYDSMTDLLVEALGIDLTGPDGIFSFTDLGLYLQQTMAASSRRAQIPQFGHLRGSQGGDLVFDVIEGAPQPLPLSQRVAGDLRGPSTWVWAGGAVAAVVIVLTALSLAGVFRPSPAEPTPTPSVEATTEEPVTEPTLSPTDTLPPTDVPTTVTEEPSITPDLDATATAAALLTQAAEEPTVDPRTVIYEEDKHGVLMARIPAGKFNMGFDTDLAFIICQGSGGGCATDNFGDEEPIHRVVLTSAYWLDVYEVTNGQYQECVSAGVCKPPEATKSRTHNSYFGNPAFRNYPVIYVTWTMADTYCREWRGGRLPTEAEWEYAARGETDWIYPWGNSAVAQGLLNFCDAGCDFTWADKRADDGYPNDTAPVGSFPDGASPFDIHDLAGNVWEWVFDWYGPYPDESVADPTGPSTGSGRVRRGGAWDNSASLVRLSNRGWNSPNRTDDNQGFRCARTP
jgi:formylglycine-generating enzyme required for sulfatase activity